MYLYCTLINRVADLTALQFHIGVLVAIQKAMDSQAGLRGARERHYEQAIVLNVKF